MRKQTLILTGWLSLPFICLTILMVWIFVSLDKDRLMDEPPVGAGAGDTGNANALGEWLAGHDPDAISRANQALRERHAIDPRDWPGGVILKVPMELVGPEPAPFVLWIQRPEKSAVEHVSVDVDTNADDQYEITLTHAQITSGTFGILPGTNSNPGSTQAFPAVHFTLPHTIPPLSVQSSDPIPVLVRKAP